MKRMHLHVSVEDIQKSIAFYSGLFGTQPAVVKNDYAKWMLDDPRINFAISMRGAKPGLDHLGLQVESAEELGALRSQFDKADLAGDHEGETTCCYAKSDKTWLVDPSGIAWEAYHTMGEAEMYQATQGQSCSPAGGCCG